MQNSLNTVTELAGQGSLIFAGKMFIEIKKGGGEELYSHKTITTKLMKVEQIELLEHIFKVRPFALPSLLRCLKTAPKLKLQISVLEQIFSKCCPQTTALK
jgi:hypothetical protein